MKSLFRVLSYIILSYMILSFLIGLFQSTPSYTLEDETTEYSETDSQKVSHTRMWYDQIYNNEYDLSYSLYNDQPNNCFENRNNFEPSIKTHWQYENYWGAVYQFLVMHDSIALQVVYDSLYQIGQDKYLDRREFANMLVSFVQDIPYSYVVPSECTEENNEHPCVDFQKFGILSPVEFLYSLNGDCDTRTTLLYSLLSHFGYKAVVFISREYAHAMLGVEIPATGDYIRHKGRKFYFWETTGTGWTAGTIPNGMENKNYWKIALDYEY